MSNEDAAVGLLVVQGRCFRPIPGKVPQAAAPLTGRGHDHAAAFDEISTAERRFSRSLAHHA